MIRRHTLLTTAIKKKKRMIDRFQMTERFNYQGLKLYYLLTQEQFADKWRFPVVSLSKFTDRVQSLAASRTCI